MHAFSVVDALPGPNGTFGLVPECNLMTGAAEMSRQLGEPLTTLETDLLSLSATIFAADLAAKRNEREGFVRDIRIDVPLVNHQLLRGHANAISAVLYLLSSDNWELNVTAKAGEQEQPRAWAQDGGRALLFSGGLDSLSAAIELLEDSPDDLLLTSHYTANPATSSSQKNLLAYLVDRFGNRVSRVAVRAGGQSSRECPFPTDREVTQRTRSFMFLCIAAIAARRKGISDLLMMAENGQMAIHVPLTSARLGAFSTRTAHPEFLAAMQGLLSTILGFPFSIQNPFVYRTKSETIARAVASHMPAVEASVSCWSSARHNPPHCGTCTPCIVRRIALEAQNVHLAEYYRDLFVEDVGSLSPDDDGKRNLVDITELVLRVSGGATNAAIQEHYPDLRNLHIDADEAIDMYRRFAQEAQTVFGRYPGIAGIM